MEGQSRECISELVHGLKMNKEAEKEDALECDKIFFFLFLFERKNERIKCHP